MSSLSWPDHLLTLQEWDALPEDLSRQFELVEGMLQMSPRPGSRHQRVQVRLAAQLLRALAATAWDVVTEVDVVLIGDPRPLVRAPDLVVVRRAVLDAAPARLQASDVVLAVEIVSPGSGRTDRIAKMADYAEAGIPYYWIVDIDDPVRLDSFQLDGSVYRAADGPIGPVPLAVDLAAL